MNDLVSLHWSQVWLLAAIYASSKDEPAGLVEVLKAAYVLNCCIMSFEELSGGLSRLIAAGLVEESAPGSRYQCTPFAIARIKVVHGDAPVYHWKQLENGLCAVRWQPARVGVDAAAVQDSLPWTAADYHIASDLAFKAMLDSGVRHWNVPYVQDRSTPLGDALCACEEYCVKECCGMNAFNVTAENLQAWANQIPAADLEVARTQVAEVLARLNDAPERFFFLDCEHPREDVVKWVERIDTTLAEVRPSDAPPT